MPRYYFNVLTRSGRVDDPEGCDLRDLDDAYVSAIDDARALMSEAILEGKDISSRMIEICDEARTCLQVISFTEAFVSAD